MPRRLQDGVYAICDELRIPGEGTSDFVFGRGWLLEIISLTTGEFYFYSDGRAMKPNSARFGVFYPPFTFVRIFVRNVHGQVRGIGSDKEPPGLPTTPFLFETDFDDEFTEIDQTFDVLEKARNRQSIEINTRPTLLSLRSKKAIDECYLTDPSISRIARRLNISHEHLSRQFKKDYGLSPSKYLHQMRVAEATFRLSQGEEIIDISLDVGYSDLSRFYKQFKKKYEMPPGQCRSSKS